MQIVLFEPEIPPNTGNISRLCAATATPLHLIKPLGFSLSDRYLKRAGLDYWEHVNLTVWENLEEFLNSQPPDRRMVGTSARHGANLHQFKFEPEDILIFGPETRGLPPEVQGLLDQHIRIPILNTVRSLNLSTAAGIVLYQALANSGAITKLL
ncbi:MAG: tRNA (cytidine(34)-2'-O)-methyltransferase [Desulfovibrionaceae bacterium]|nr:tRNA (cytidine(34)-2'-O)-methyltransferase [Desulfovibrionaceae bacterium]